MRRKSNRYYPPANRFSQLMRGAAPFISRASRAARFNLARSRTRLRQNRQIRSRPGVLGGTDANQRLIYVRTNMPRRKKRQWRSFVKKVNAVDEKDLGTRTYLFNNQIQHTISSSGSSSHQGCLTLGLYCLGGQTSTQPYLRDLALIGSSENVQAETVTAGGTVYPTTKVMFHSGIFDLTLRNASVQNIGTPSVPNIVNSGDIELDLYEITLNRDDQTFWNGSTVNQWNSLSELFNFLDTPEIGGTGNGMNIEDRGATPWEFPHQLGRYRCQINKKTKFFIPNGRTITYQMRDPKRHVFQYGDLTGSFSINKTGVTKFLYIIYKLVPGLSQANNPVLLPAQYDGRIELGVTRKYMYKIEGFNEDRERYVTSDVSVVNPV